jgi:IclR family KDG regulon transcriptional repressor
VSIVQQQTKPKNMKSLTKALDILQIFMDSRRDMALGEISQKSGLNKTTVSRILSTLVSRNYIKQREKRGNYSLGPIYLEFSGIFKSDIQLRKVAGNYLTKLANSVHESVMIAYGNGRGTVFTETFRDSQMSQILKVVPEEGISMPLHATGLGKILLANLSDQEIVAYFQNKGMKRYTPNTIVDLDKMKNHLITVRQEGIASDDEEFTVGVRGVGTGIRDNEGDIVASIAVVAPSVRLSRSRMRELIPEIRNCALEISKELGFNG